MAHRAATATRDRTNIILTPLLAVASPAAPPLQRLLWSPRKLLLAIAMTGPLLHHRNGIVSGKTTSTSTQSLRQMTKSARSSKSRTAGARLHHTTCRRHRLLATAHTAPQMHVDSTMVTILPKRRIIRNLFLQWAQRHARCLACLRHRSRNGLSITSLLHATWMSMKITTTREMTRSPVPLSMTQMALLMRQHQSSRSRRRSSSTGRCYLIYGVLYVWPLGNGHQKGKNV